MLWTQAFACNYHTAVVAEHDFTSAIKAFQQAETNEFQAGNIDASTHQAMEQGILSVAEGGQQLAALLQKNASKQSVINEILLVDTALANLNANGVLYVKTPTTQRNLAIAFTAMHDILANFSTLYGTTLPVTITVTGGAL